MLNIFNQSISALAPLTFGAREFFVVEANLCTVECLAAVLASSPSKMSVAFPQLGQLILSQDIAKCPLGGKTVPPPCRKSLF